MISRAELISIKHERQRWMIFGIICSLLLGLIIWFFIINQSLNNLISSRQETIAKIINDTNSLKKEGQINLSKSDLESLYKIEKDRIRWSVLFKEIASFIPEDMSILNIRYKHKKLTISAISSIDPGEKEFTVIEEFISLLEKNNIFSKHFSSVKFNNSRLDKSQGQEFLFFEVELILNTKKTKKK